MKNIIFVSVLLASVCTIAAQESYTIKMSVHMEGLPPEYAAYGNQDIVSYIKGGKSKTTVSSVMYNSTVYFDGEKITTLNDMMGNKQGFTATRQEMEAADAMGKKSNPKIEYTDEKKMIAGYTCKKAVITPDTDEKNAGRITAWVTEDLKIDPPPGQTNSAMNGLGDLKGHPLEIQVTQESDGQEVNIIMTTTEIIRKPLPDSTFVANTEGYDMLSFTDWQAQLKAAGK